MKKIRQRAGLTLALVGLAGLVLVLSLKTNNKQAPPRIAQEQLTKTIAAPTAPSPIFELLRIRSSGRLPQEAQGLRLGMTIADALRVEPGLTALAANGRVVDPSASDAVLLGKSDRGFSSDLLFENGRLIWIKFGLMNVNPVDASALRADTIQQLGSPTTVVRDFPEITQLVWIDGDVRTAYEDADDVYHARHPNLTIVEWPIYSSDFRKLGFRDFEIKSVFANWAYQPVVGRPLPRDLSGLSLGMSSWQMRAALGSEGLTRPPLCNAGCDCWQKDLPTDRSLSVVMWHDKAMEIFEKRKSLQSPQPGSIAGGWFAQYGTAAQPLGPLFRWTDGQVAVNCGEPESSTGGGPVEWNCWLQDLGLYRTYMTEMVGQRATRFSVLPNPKSFF